MRISANLLVVSLVCFVVALLKGWPVLAGMTLMTSAGFIALTTMMALRYFSNGRF